MNCTLLIVFLGIFSYDQKNIFRGHIWQNDVNRLSAFCPNVVFGIMSLCLSSLSVTFLFQNLSCFVRLGYIHIISYYPNIYICFTFIRNTELMKDQILAVNSLIIFVYIKNIFLNNLNIFFLNMNNNIALFLFFPFYTLNKTCLGRFQDCGRGKN